MFTIDDYREFLKGDLWAGFESMDTDARKEIPAPPVQKAYPEDAVLVELVSPENLTAGNKPLKDLIANRRSVRKFSAEALAIEELSFLLWATQGTLEPTGRLRTVPSAGARQPFETYLVIENVKQLEPGLYRYLPLDHKLLTLRTDKNFFSEYRKIGYLYESSVLFIWTAIPYRTEWRYGIISHKMIALDAGHVCRNLYLACGAIGAGTCAVGAYDHKAIDSLIGVDGKNEFAVYLAPVGKTEE